MQYGIPDKKWPGSVLKQQPGHNRGRLFVQQNGRDDASGCSNQDEVTADLYPVMVAGRLAQPVCFPVVYPIRVTAILLRYAFTLSEIHRRP